jgi:methylated-DNA-[protein]-cysteine S-methyltransferase
MTNALFHSTINVPFGQLTITSTRYELVSINLTATDTTVLAPQHPPEIAQNAIEQLTCYFEQAQQNWTLPLAVKGTEFQQKVWQTLQTIAVGETRCYSDIAQQLNTSARAVGNACRANQFAIVIPCHRVVSRHGLGGYYGKTEGEQLNIKQWLLNHERR